MKKIIILILLLLLTSCNLYENEEIKNILENDYLSKCVEENKNNLKERKEIIKDCINSNITNNNTNISGTGYNINLELKVGEIDFRKYIGNIKEIIFPVSYDIFVGNNNSEELKTFLLNNKSNNLRINFEKYIDKNYSILDYINFTNLKDLSLDFGGDYKSLENTLNILYQKINKRINLYLFFENYDLPKKDINILSELNISNLLLSGKLNINKEFDKKIINILNKSKTLYSITIDEYKIFKKENGIIKEKNISLKK